MSAEYEARGLAEVCVDNQQIGALHTENNRERQVNESRAADIQMLREQVARGEDIRKKQEAEIKEQCEKITEIHNNYQQQMNEKEQNHQDHLNKKEQEWQKQLKELQASTQNMLTEMQANC